MDAFNTNLDLLLKTVVSENIKDDFKYDLICNHFGYPSFLIASAV